MKRMILPTLVTILVVAAIAGIFIVRSQSSSAKSAAGWTTYHDPLGLYTINYPAGWKAAGSVSTGGQIVNPAFTIDLAGTSDGVDITETSNPNMTIHIGAIKFTNSNTEGYFCHHPLSYPFYASGSFPDDMPAGSTFNTTNAHFQIDVGPPHGDVNIPASAKPTPVPASAIKAETATYTSILSTFKSLAPAGSSC